MTEKVFRMCDHCPGPAERPTAYALSVEGETLDACGTACMVELVKRLTAERKAVTVRRQPSGGT